MAEPGICAWQDDFILDAYRLSFQGCSQGEIAESFGVSRQTVVNWLRDRPVFARAIREGKRDRRLHRRIHADTTTLAEHVYERLSPRVRELWDALEAAESRSNGRQEILRMLEGEDEPTLQRLFIFTLISRAFNLSQACTIVGVSKKKVEQWCEDPAFGELFDEVRWHKGNFFEDALIKSVKRGDTQAVLFANKTYNSDRGYGESLKLNSDSNQKETHVIKVSELDLPPELVLQLVAAMRARKERLERAQPTQVIGRFVPLLPGTEEPD